ncbi:hypothetical protein M5K25_005877 [Dendrobium thyrsiflorum]|uniref:Uncharacterized protein n=1 Tax=Dendrobium thyrsiflorum TaxID=117978 RepID=A0ABD0VH60_DENTH
MASEGILSISMQSVVEDVIKQHAMRLSDVDLATRRAEEAATRRYEAAAWLRRTVGVVGAKDLPEEPSEEEFRIGLRNGIILCNVINKVQPGAIPKVVEVPIDSFFIPDGAPLSAYQYFENVRNFLVTLQDMGLPTFEASDLERGGKSSRVVDSVLALKSYIEGKQSGKNGSSNFGGITRPGSLSKHFMRKSSDPFMNFISPTQSLPEKSSDDLSLEDNFNGDFSVQSTEMKSSRSLNMLIHTALSNKKPEEVPSLVETILNKVMQEFEQRIANQKERMVVRGKVSKGNEEVVNMKENAGNELKESHVKQQEKEAEARELKERSMLMEQQLKLEAKSFQDRHFLQQHKAKSMEENDRAEMEEKANIERLNKQQAKEMKQKALKERLINQQLIFDRQQKEIQELKCALHFTKTSMEHLKTHHYKEFDNLGNQLRALASAASGYHKVLAENRKLYNQIQDLKGNIRVYCRVRPFLPGQMSNMSTLGRIDDQNITIFSPLKTGKDARRNFTFNKVFGPLATQEEVFSDTQPLIRSVLDGYNVCIFAYGQTGSGKTHTMSGPKELNEKTFGVNYRALNDLFCLTEQRKETFTYEISVQMVEIYNEQVRDLLNDGLNKRLEIRNCSNKGLSVPDANLVPVRSIEEVIEIMNLGQRNRAVSCTAMNDHSSRSHSCLTIHVQGKELTSGYALRGCMHLVDLAGSERVDKSEVKGERLKEAQYINKSLSALGDVIASLARKNAHVPYRNSKLTQLLQDSLGGQAKTLMFVHISPEVDALGETLSTLKFAERVATVELGAAKINKDNGEAKDLKEQVAFLKMESVRKGAGEPIRPTMFSPDLLRLKTDAACSTSSNDEEDELDYPTSNRQSMEEAGHIEARSNATRQNKLNYHDEELQVSMDLPWPDSCPRLDENNMEKRSGEWVDKVAVNNRNRAPSGEENGTQEEQVFFQRYLNEMRVFPDQQVNSSASGKKVEKHDLQQNRFDSDSDDFENSASDSSEVELLSHLSASKIPSIADVGMSKLRRPQAKGIKSVDGRNLSHGNIPSPSRKMLNGPSQIPNRTARQPGSGDGKRSGIKSSGK